jgi:hypothetical protein
MDESTFRATQCETDDHNMNMTDPIPRITGLERVEFLRLTDCNGLVPQIPPYLLFGPRYGTSLRLCL